MKLQLFVSRAILIVLGFDLVASVASRVLGFSYMYAGLGSICLYLVLGYLAARSNGMSASLLAGLAVGAADASLGWAISWSIGPGRVPSGFDNPTPLFAGVVSVVLLAVFCSAVGGAAGSHAAKRTSP